MALLYVGQVSRSTKLEDLEDLLSKYGRLKSFRLKSDYGFAEYEEDRDAEDAIENLHGFSIHGSRLIVQHAHNSRSRYRKDFSRDQGPRCFNCGKIGHRSDSCRAGDWNNRCYNCGGKGHIRTNCTEEMVGRGYDARDKAAEGHDDWGRDRGYDRYNRRSPPRRRDYGRSRSYRRSYSRSRSRSYSRRNRRDY